MLGPFLSYGEPFLGLPPPTKISAGAHGSPLEVPVHVIELTIPTLIHLNIGTKLITKTVWAQKHELLRTACIW